MAGGAALVLVLALLVFTALTVWIVCLCSPRITAKRFFSDVYTCQPLDEKTGKPVPGTCVVRWSLTERVVTMTLDLAVALTDELLTDDACLVLDLMLPPAKASSRYLSGFGMSTAGARCFVEPIADTSGPKARLRLSGMHLRHPQEQAQPAQHSQHFTVVAQMMV